MTDSEPKTDGDLVARTLGGDRQAYTMLVRRYQNLVFGVAYHWLGNFDEAHDAAQDAFVSAYRRLGELREPDGFRGWLRSIAANECRMRLRSQHQHAPFEEATVAVTHHEGTDQRIDVSRALESLSADSRLTVLLFYFQDLSLKEIAQFLGVPESTVMSRLRNARARLRKDLMHMAESTIRQNALPEDFADRIPVPYDEIDWSSVSTTPIAPLSEWRENWLLGAYPEGTMITAVHEEGYDWQREPDRPVRVTVRPYGAPPEDVVLRTNGRKGGTDLEAALLPVLSDLGLPVPRLVAGPEQDPALEGRGTLIAVTAPLGCSAIEWCLERNVVAIAKACETTIDGIDLLNGATQGVLSSSAAALIETCSLSEELHRTIEIGGPWMQDERFLEGIRRLEPHVESIAEPLVFSDSGIANARVDEEGTLVGFETFAWARIEDPLYAVTKYWTYDCWPLRWAGFVERYLVRHGRTMRDLAPRLGVRALVTLQREIPVRGGDAAYRDDMLGWLRLALDTLG